jgi:hypothetical protein
VRPCCKRRRTPGRLASGWRASRGAASALVAALLLAVPAGAATEADSVRYVVRVTSQNRVGLTVSNYGFFGNNFINRSPSFEFPLGTGYEHMSRAGLWIGGRALSDTGEFLAVSTGIVDNAQGTNALAETEFTPAGNNILVRSRIRNSNVYSASAVSDQDFVCSYSDLPARPPRGFNQEPHRPLQILVQQETYVFGLLPASSLVILHLKVRNLGPPLRDVYLGLYAQLVSGDKNAYSTWPPSATSGPGSWYYKTHFEYDAARRLYKEHYCARLPFPGDCNFEYCPPWAAVKLLGVSPEPIASKTISFNWWSYSPGDTARDTDAERYAFLTGAHPPNSTPCDPGGSCSPIMVLSVGPFAYVAPDSSFDTDFAFVAGEDEQHLLDSAEFAQFAYDLHYRLPAAPSSPFLHAEARQGAVDLYWDRSPEDEVDDTSLLPGGKDFQGYRVYLGEDRQHLPLVAQFDIRDTTGFNTGLEGAAVAPAMFPGDTVVYRYRFAVPGLRSGFKYFASVTSFDTGDRQVSSLESAQEQHKLMVVPGPAPGERGGVVVFPNPYRVEARWDAGALVRDHYLWFANLPERCVLRIYTLAGDLVKRVDLDGASGGAAARGLYSPTRDYPLAPPSLSGTCFAWDLVTERGQAVATGLYLFSVEDLRTGETEQSKFLVVKSDREGR